MELEITQKGKAEIVFLNHEELKTELKNALEKYRNVIYSDDSIIEAKADRAKLNNLTKAIDDKRKEIKKACMEPYEQFEAKVKELTALIAAPVAEIDGQVKRFESSKKDAKRKELQDFADAESSVLIPYKDKFLASSFVTEKMLNSTVTIKKAKEEISQDIAKVKEGIDLILTFPEQRQAGLILSFSVGRDLAAVIKRNNELDEIEKIQAKQKEQAKKEELAKSQIVTADVVEQAPDEMTYKLKVTGSRQALVELRKYIAAAGIKYEKLE